MENSIASAHSKGRTKLLPSSLATDPAFPTPALPTALLSGSAGRSAKKNGRKAHFLIVLCEAVHCSFPFIRTTPLGSGHHHSHVLRGVSTLRDVNSESCCFSGTGWQGRKKQLVSIQGQPKPLPSHGLCLTLPEHLHYVWAHSRGSLSSGLGAGAGRDWCH